MVVHEKLTGSKFVGVRDVQQMPLWCIFLLEVFTGGGASHTHVSHEACDVTRNAPEEFLRHFAPHFCTLNIGDVSIPCQIQPVCFIEFGTDKEILVSDEGVLTHERRRQSQFAMRFDDANHLHMPSLPCTNKHASCEMDLTKNLGRYYMHFIQQN